MCETKLKHKNKIKYNNIFNKNYVIFYVVHTTYKLNIYFFVRDSCVEKSYDERA